MSPDKQRPEKRPPEKKLPEKRRPEKKAPEKKATEKRAPEKQLPVKQPVKTIAALEVEELEALRAEVARTAQDGSPLRWNADPEEVQRSVGKLVLTLVEFIRKLLERQALRRMESGTLSPEEVERVGLALLKLEEAVLDLAARFGLSPRELNLDLGPLGKLL